MADKKISKTYQSFTNLAAICLLTFAVTFSLLARSKPQQIQLNTKATPNADNISISSELTSLSDRLSFIWTSTRDNILRKPRANHRYGLELKTKHHTIHLLLYILLAGDIATNPGPAMSVKCLGLNARSLTSLVKDKTESNLERFQNFVYSEDLDIVCVNETWLSNNVYNAEILHSGYTIFRKDRKSRGGGVLLGIKSETFKSGREINHNHDLEISVAELTTSSNMNLLICSCYRPPDADQTWMDKFESFLQDVCTHHPKIVLAGDFNLPHVCRNSQELTTGTNENTFISILRDFFLEQVNTTPTRGNNILDLVITSTPERIHISEVLKPTDSEILTDHSAIIFDISLMSNPVPKIKRTVFDYRRADFDGLRSHLHSSLNLTETISMDGDINQDWYDWKNSFLEAVSDFVPQKTLRSRNYLPWMNSGILHLIKMKNSISNRIKTSCSPSKHLLDKFRELRTQIKLMLRESRLEYINSICLSRCHNPKRFWSFFKIKSKVSNIPEKVSTKASDGKRINADNNVEIAESFNKYFVSIFSSDSTTVGHHQQNSQSAITLEEITLTNDEVLSVLINLDNKKAQGPDGIPARLLTETAFQITPSLCSLFNKSLRSCIHPDDWKLANVVPVHKKGDKAHVENYRPISLLSIISKVLERCVFNNIKHHVFQQINPSQHGFVPGKSCVTQLVEVFE